MLGICGACVLQAAFTMLVSCACVTGQSFALHIFSFHCFRGKNTAFCMVHMNGTVHFVVGPAQKYYGRQNWTIGEARHLFGPYLAEVIFFGGGGGKIFFKFQFRG